MATEKEEVIFELEIAPKDSFTELEKFKKAILDAKQEQKELNTALKKGQITQKEFIQESIRVEATLKKNQSAYNNVQKSVTGVKTQLDKLIISNEKISKDLKKTSQSFQDVAGQINVAGVNVGGLTSRLASFANPATAAVGIVTALGAAYASSTRGAQDLEKANDLLGASLDVISNKLFTGQGGQFSADSIFGFFQQFGPTSFLATGVKALFQDVIDEIDALAEARKRLRDIELLDFKDAQRLAKDALKTAEQNRRYRDDESKSLQNRLAAANDVEGSINKFESALLKVQGDRLKAAQEILKLNDTDVQARSLVKDIEREIADIQEDAEGKRTEALNGVLAIEKLISAERLKQSGASTELPSGVEGIANVSGVKKNKKKEDSTILDGSLAIVDSERVVLSALKEITKGVEQNNAQQARSYNLKANTAKTASELEVASIEAVGYSAQLAASIFEENTVAYKVLASADAIINTYKGANLALGTFPPPFSYIAAAVTVAAGLANVAKINGAEFADGGWTGPGSKYQPAGIVHADEYVAPKHIVHNPAAQPHLQALENMRLRGYADGGLVTNTLTAEVNQTVMQENMMKRVMKNMPAPVVGVKQFTKVANSVKVKENAVGRIR